MKFGHLILRKIFKFIASRCQILRLKCTKSKFGCSSEPDPAGGTYSAPQTPQLDLRGLLPSRGRDGEWREGSGEGRGWKRRGGREETSPQRLVYTPCSKF